MFALASRGVEFERYEGMEQDERGIAHVGPDIAWFKDPGREHPVGHPGFVGPERPAGARQPLRRTLTATARLR
jgi:hypothetical protein